MSEFVGEQGGGRGADLDSALARAIARHWPQSDTAALALVAAVSRAVRGAHACIDFASAAAVDYLPQGLDRAGALALARRAAFVGGPGSRAPLILDGERLYLRRYFSYEHRVAENLLRRARVIAGAGAPVPRNERDDGALGDLQHSAVMLAQRSALVVLCGGPGTGKTHTSARIAAAWRAELGEGARIALAAPTGKAAARLGEALRGRAIGAVAVSTVHRLIGLSVASVRPWHHPENPIDADGVIVDEGSMLDLPTMARLLDALAPDTRLVLVGDPFQLPAIESGAVLPALATLARHDPPPDERSKAGTGGVSAASPIADCIITLTGGRRFRGDSALARLLDAVRAGAVDDARAALTSGGAELLWLRPGPERARELDATLRNGLASLRAAPDPAAALIALERFRILAALREGPFGVAGLNAWAAQRVFDASATRAFSRCPILIERNAPELELYNGDLGVLWRTGGGGWEVWLGDPTAPRRIARERLPAHQSALAMTVHKAQGSEFDEVLLVLPPEPHPLLTREWLYTALSRARRRVILAADEATLAAAIARPTVRMQGLTDRLRIDAELAEA